MREHESAKVVRAGAPVRPSRFRVGWDAAAGLDVGCGASGEGGMRRVNLPRRSSVRRPTRSRMNPEAATTPRLRSPLIPVAVGFALALPFLGFFQLHPDGAFDLLALILALTGGIYVGAALRGGTRGRLAFETIAAAALVIMAFLGLSWSPLWIAAGFALHGAWDLAHHTGAVTHGVRRWFPPFCASWDWAIAAMVVYFS